MLRIQNSLHVSKFSFVEGSRNSRFVLWCSHTRVQEKKQTDTHAFDNDHFTQEGVKHEHIKRKRTKLESSLDAMAGKQESKAIKCSTSSTVSHYSDNQPPTVMFIQSSKLMKRTVAYAILHSSYGLMVFTTWITKLPV